MPGFSDSPTSTETDASTFPRQDGWAGGTEGGIGQRGPRDDSREPHELDQ